MAQPKFVPAPFLTKTYQLVEERSVDDIISWNEDGTSFIVWKPNEFARDLLPNHFKHNNFSSFVRQLNTYGFKKVVADRWEFANEFFRRGEKGMLFEIHRRKSAAGRSSSASNSNNDEQAGTSSYASSSTDLWDENEKLRRDNQQLSTELARAKEQCGELLALFGKYVEQGRVKGLMVGEEEEDRGDGVLKLFGVRLGGKRRRWVEGDEQVGVGVGGMRILGIREPWMKVCY